LPSPARSREAGSGDADLRRYACDFAHYSARMVATPKHPRGHWAARVACCTLAVPLLLAAPALAHGGEYRGPGNPGPGLPIPGVPGGGGGPGQPTPGPGTPTTGATQVINDETGWQLWWSFNQDEFLQIGGAGLIAAKSRDDDYLMNRTSVPVDLLQPADVDVRDRIVPALARMLARESSRDIQSACAVALGKIGMDAPGFDLEQALAALVARDDQEVRESGVLALGMSGRAKALPLLLGLLRDDAVGRKLAGRATVGDRTRAFAAFGLGLLARHSDDPALKLQIRDALWELLQSKDEQGRDLRSAVVNGLGILVADPEASLHKRLAWETAERLLEWYGRDLGRGDEAVQAHAPVAIGRLLGRGDGQIHIRCKEVFAGEFTAAKRRSNPILRSASLALGMLCLPRDVCARDGVFLEALRRFWTDGSDRLARNLAAIALGRVGGAENRAWLLETYARASRNVEQPWLAIALGLCAARAAKEGVPDEALARLLLGEIGGATKPEGQSALAVAIGLTGCRLAAPTLLRHLKDEEREEMLAGYFAVGLALLGDPASATPLIAVMERSKRRPFLLLQSAIALGRIGDRRANERLLVMLKASESAVVLGGIANAIGQIGDRRAIDPLIELSQDDQVTRLARAFVAAALGGIGDRRPLPWNMPLSRDSSYAGAVDTLTNGSTGVLDIL
jgi:HEAT repeat protein